MKKTRADAVSIQAVVPESILNLRITANNFGVTNSPELFKLKSMELMFLKYCPVVK